MLRGVLFHCARGTHLRAKLYRRGVEELPCRTNDHQILPKKPRNELFPLFPSSPFPLPFPYFFLSSWFSFFPSSPSHPFPLFPPPLFFFLPPLPLHHPGRVGRARAQAGHGPIGIRRWKQALPARDKRLLRPRRPLGDSCARSRRQITPTY